MLIFLFYTDERTGNWGRAIRLSVPLVKRSDKKTKSVAARRGDSFSLHLHVVKSATVSGRLKVPSDSPLV